MTRVQVADIPMLLRPMQPDDRAFVGSTWGKSYERFAPVCRAVYLAEHRRVIDRCLDDAATMVLAPEARPTTLFGWACGERGVLHWAYVVPELRKNGAAKLLVCAVTGTSHAGALTISHRPPKGCRAVWNPYVLGLAA